MIGKRYVTAFDIEYKAAPYGLIATIPAGTPCQPATNLPDSAGIQYWCDRWDGMGERAEGWARGYGFLLGDDEVDTLNPQADEPWAGDADRFREPDVSMPGLAIWYGPGGVDGDCATVVEGETVTTYQCVEGMIENPPAPYLVSRCHIENPADDRDAAGLGVAYLAYYGADDSWADELPS